MTDLRQRLQHTLSGAYTLERELGGGGMSRVFVADEHRFGRKVVVKVLSPDLAAGLSAERFEREIRTAAGLQQANIVPVISAGETDGLPWYTMPFVEGESLRARIAAGPLPMSQVLRILEDVARALAHAHARGIVHRDIKPDNILLSGGTAVVTDFGIAKAIEQSRTNTAESRAPRAESATAFTAIGTAIGTPAYMAPEQAAGDPSTDHRADLYAFGCTAYELLAGHPPFHGQAAHRLIGAHMTQPPQPVDELRPDAPTALARLVMRCLAKDPADRPASADEILRELESVTSGSGVAPVTVLPARGTFLKALALYAGAFLVVALVARAVTHALALPDWVFPGTLVVMALGLPVILFTGWAHLVARRAAVATPTLTPGGTLAPATQGTLANIAVKASPHLSWRRAARGGVIALAAFVLLVAGWAALRVLGIGPAGSLLAAGTLRQDDQVLVARFEAPAADSSLGATIAEAVRTNLAQSRAVHVVPTSAIVAALQRMQRPASTAVDLDVGREVAVREGIKAVVGGSIVPAGGGYIITARLVTAEGGDELASFREAAGDAEAIIPAVDRLTRKLRGKMGESLRTVRDAPALQQVSTSSLGALRSYTAALRANDVDGDFRKAVTLFEEAVRQDTAFAAAYVQMAYSISSARLGPARRDSALALAFRFRERLPEAERYAVEGAWYTSGPAADRRKSIAAFERAVELDSTNADALNSLAIGYSIMRDYDRAARTYRRAIALVPSNGLVQANHINMLTTGRRFDEADSALRAAKALRLPFPFLARELELLVRRGAYDSAGAVARAATRDSNPRVAATAIGYVGEVALLRGRPDEAFRLFDRANAVDGAPPGPARPFAVAIDRAWIDGFLRDRPSVGIGHLDAALRAHSLAALPAQNQVPFGIARTYALLGRPDRARAVFDAYVARLDSAGVRRSEAGRHAVLAEILLAERRWDEAAEAARRADVHSNGVPAPCAVCLPILLGRIHDGAGRRDSAIVQLERFLTAPGSGRAEAEAWFLAPTLRRLGELYEDRGDTARALDYYRRFVELWKNAEPELQPKVTEVRERITRLERARQ